MTISKDLLLAILSMDSYNRGYGAGITDGGTNDPDGLGDAIGTKIGTATVSGRSSSNPNSTEVAAGFYAIAYDVKAAGVDGLDKGNYIDSLLNTLITVWR